MGSSCPADRTVPYLDVGMENRGTEGPRGAGEGAVSCLLRLPLHVRLVDGRGDGLSDEAAGALVVDDEDGAGAGDEEAAHDGRGEHRGGENSRAENRADAAAEGRIVVADTGKGPENARLHIDQDAAGGVLPYVLDDLQDLPAAPIDSTACLDDHCEGSQHGKRRKMGQRTCWECTPRAEHAGPLAANRFSPKAPAGILHMNPPRPRPRPLLRRLLLLPPRRYRECPAPEEEEEAAGEEGVPADDDAVSANDVDVTPEQVRALALVPARGGGGDAGCDRRTGGDCAESARRPLRDVGWI